MVDFQNRLVLFDSRQTSIEGKITVSKAKFEEVSGLTKINELKGFIGTEVTNEGLS